MKPKLTITARLNPQEKGSNFSKHFQEAWINNKTLHPFCKAIPITKSITHFKPSLTLYANGNIVRTITGNYLGKTAQLQQFILDTYLDK